MNYLCFIFLIYIITCCNVNECTSSFIPIAKEVFIGELCNIFCSCNNENNRFQFWETPEGIIGPGSNKNLTLYNYEVITGKLNVKIISIKQEGIYNCYCRNFKTETYEIDTEILKIRRNIEESNIESIVYKTILLCSILIILASVIFFMFELKDTNLFHQILFKEISKLRDDQEAFLVEEIEMTPRSLNDLQEK